MQGQGGSCRGQKQAYSRLLVFLIGGNITGLLRLLDLLSGDHCLLINFTPDSRLALLLLVILLFAFLLGALAGTSVNARLVVVALPSTCAHGGIGDTCPDAGLFAFQ